MIRRPGSGLISGSTFNSVSFTSIQESNGGTYFPYSRASCVNSINGSLSPPFQFQGISRC